MIKTRAREIRQRNRSIIQREIIRRDNSINADGVVSSRNELRSRKAIRFEFWSSRVNATFGAVEKHETQRGYRRRGSEKPPTVRH